MPTLEASSFNPFPRLSIACIERQARSVRYQQNQFRRLHGLLVDEKGLLLQALRDDFGFSDFEALFEFSLTLLELRYHYDSLDLKREVAASRAIEDKKQDASRTVGTGIVYIMPRVGLLSILSPICAAMAAGNCVIVEVGS